MDSELKIRKVKRTVQRVGLVTKERDALDWRCIEALTDLSASEGLDIGTERSEQSSLSSRRVVGSGMLRGVVIVLAVLSFGRVSVDATASSPFGNLPPATVSRFVPETSTTWRGNDALRFSSTYAQGTTVKGFLCSDYVQLGPYC